MSRHCQQGARLTDAICLPCANVRQAQVESACAQPSPRTFLLFVRDERPTPEEHATKSSRHLQAFSRTGTHAQRNVVSSAAFTAISAPKVRLNTSNCLPRNVCGVSQLNHQPKTINTRARTTRRRGLSMPISKKRKDQQEKKTPCVASLPASRPAGPDERNLVLCKLLVSISYRKRQILPPRRESKGREQSPPRG